MECTVEQALFYQGDKRAQPLGNDSTGNRCRNHIGDNDNYTQHPPKATTTLIETQLIQT
jgi:hypothetical protein